MTAMTTWSVAAVLCWSSAAKVKVMVVLAETSGAAKVADREVALSRIIPRSGRSWVHR